MSLASLSLPLSALRELQRDLEGGLLTGASTRQMFAEDASPYRETPLAVAQPRSVDDCTAIVRFAQQYGVPLTPRGGGTGLAGQSIGAGIVVDFSRHMNDIVSVDRERSSAWVRPGVVPAQLNAALLGDGLVFRPDPSTLDRCTIGGMVGTNAWGSHWLRDGDTADHLLSLEVILHDGKRHRFTRDDGAGETGPWGEPLDRMRGARRDRIAQAFPDELPNNSGYALDRAWRPDGGLDVVRLFCGAQGTLGLVVGIELRLRPVVSHSRVYTLHFDTLENALRCVPGLVRGRRWEVAGVQEKGVSAIELLDAGLIARTRENPLLKEHRFWIQGDPAAVLLVDIDAPGVAELAREGVDLEARLGNVQGLYHCCAYEGSARDKVFALRRASLGSLMGMRGGLQAVTGMEDAAVPLAHLSEYCEQFLSAVRAHGIETICYGSVGAGLIQFRPLLDLHESAHREIFSALQSEQAAIVARFGGTISAKHADGRIRAGLLSMMYPPFILTLFRDLKDRFDPKGVFNPGKIFSEKGPLEDLRVDECAPKEVEPQGFSWHPFGLRDALERCQGAAACRKGVDLGSMCPTFPILGRESATTRGRANLLRQAFNDPVGVCDRTLLVALRTCVACKACKRECPAGVDMARLKSEALYRKRLRSGADLAEQVAAALPGLLALGSRIPALANRVLATNLAKDILKVDTRRELPRLVRRAPMVAPRVDVPADRELLLLLDPYSAFLQPNILRAAMQLLQGLSWRVHLSPWVSSGRAAISVGHLRRARRDLRVTLRRVRPWLQQGIPIVSLEPSEALTFRDEGPDLLPGPAMAELASRVRLLDEFLLEQTADGELCADIDTDVPVLVHTHCHQKSLLGDGTCSRLLRRFGLRDVHDIRSGCCGMAGFFGYQRGNYELSRAMAETSLLPSIRASASNALLVANGFSCREQLRTTGVAEVLHLSEFLNRILQRRGQRGLARSDGRNRSDTDAR